MSATRLLRPLVMNWRIPAAWQERLPILLILAGLAIGVWACWGLICSNYRLRPWWLSLSGSTRWLEIKAQEALARFGLRVLVLLLAGLVIALGNARPGDATQVVDRSEHAARLDRLWRAAGS